MNSPDIFYYEGLLFIILGILSILFDKNKEIKIDIFPEDYKRVNVFSHAFKSLFSAYKLIDMITAILFLLWNIIGFWHPEKILFIILFIAPYIINIMEISLKNFTINYEVNKKKGFITWVFNSIIILIIIYYHFKND